MGSIKSEFVLRNVNFDDCLNYYKEAILKKYFNETYEGVIYREKR